MGGVGVLRTLGVGVGFYPTPTPEVQFNRFVNRTPHANKFVALVSNTMRIVSNRYYQHNKLK